MSEELLAALRFMKMAHTSAAASADPAVAMQQAVLSRLIDYFIAREAPARELRRRAVSRARALLSEARLEASAAIVPRLLDGADVAEFATFMRSLAQLQRQLVAQVAPDMLRVAKSLAAIEAQYHCDLHASVQAEAARVAVRGPQSARNSREYDERRLAQFIRQSFPDEGDIDVESSTIIAGGMSKITVGIQLKGTRVLPRELILRADAAATFGGVSSVEEYRLLRVLHAHGVLVPRPLAVEESGDVFGSKFMLVEKRPGGSIGHMFQLPQPNADVCRDVARQLAAIHRIPVAEFGERVDNARGTNSNKARAWLAEGLAAWRPLDMPSPAFEAAFAWLERNADLNDKMPRALVHGDAHLNNMLVHEGRLSVILDWEFAHIGNAAYDLGYFYDQAVALESWDGFLRAYGEAGGIVPDEAQLNYAILFGATRLGVMVCQSLAEFRGAAEPGLAGAAVLSQNFYEFTIERIDRVLQRVS